MATAQTDAPTRQKSLRLWPGVIAVVLLWLARFGLKLVVPGFEGFRLGLTGSIFAAGAVVVWWVFLSRAPWLERLGAVVLMTVALAAAWRFKHETMGPLWLAGYAVPVLLLAFVAWAVASRHLTVGRRRAAMAATILLACGAWMLVRTGGVDGDHDSQFAWRWSETVEERLVAQALDPPVAPEPVPAAAAQRDWPGFRGSDRDGKVRGVQIEADWTRSPPVELWRRPVGPGWSSLAVGGDLLYTQEQRGDDEVVACYGVTTGEPVWMHRDTVRFFESNAGAGPRATPTLSDGRVVTFGATGILNVLDARDGAVVWSRNAASDTGAELPDWGFSSSPLVVGDEVVVAVSGQLAAYDLATGDRRWTGPAGGVSYSSPHPTTIDGVPQVLLLSGTGASSVAPADGTLLWEHPWKGFPIVQPAVTADGDVLVTASGGSGVRRIAVAHGPGGWTVDERWTSLWMKPYFNDFVVHEGHAFGFDNRILACIDLEDGERKWKGGRYGNGQLVLLSDQDLLLVLSEQGELALVAATPEAFTELARFPAVEGKTWNHPVLAGNLLLARNGQEMAAFRLPLTDG